jgi:hypothetical protein
MSIEAKHAYRFGFLKSEKWSQIRLETLVHFHSRCYICGKEKYNNDVHHVTYPEDLNDSCLKNLVVLYRTCHEFIHGFMDHRKIESPSRQWKVIKEFAKYFGAITSDAEAVVVKAEKKVFHKAVQIARSACLGCGCMDGVERRNPFDLIGHVWMARLCAACCDKTAQHVLLNAYPLDPDSRKWALAKKFLRTIPKMPVDKPDPQH